MTRLSVVIPTYNEINYILAVLQRVQQVHLPGIAVEVVVVDDCSQDGTRELLQEAAALQSVGKKEGVLLGQTVRLDNLRFCFQDFNQALRRGQVFTLDMGLFLE